MADKIYKVIGDLSILASESGEDYPATLYLQRPGCAPFPLVLHEAASLVVILENARRELMLREVEKK